MIEINRSGQRQPALSKLFFRLHINKSTFTVDNREFFDSVSLNFSRDQAPPISSLTVVLLATAVAKTKRRRRFTRVVVNLPLFAYF
jgi:hypothetical protein